MWLADTATTSHIANSRTVFDTLETLKRPVNGVGNVLIYAEGKGTVNIQLKVGAKNNPVTTGILYKVNNFLIKREESMYSRTPNSVTQISRACKKAGRYGINDMDTSV